MAETSVVKSQPSVPHGANLFDVDEYQQAVMVHGIFLLLYINNIIIIMNEYPYITQNKQSSDALTLAMKQASFQLSGKRRHTQ